PAVWEEDVHGPLFRELVQQLAEHDALDLSPLQSGNQTLAELGKPAPAESFDRLIALVPGEGKAAAFMEELQRLASPARPGAWFDLQGKRDDQGGLPEQVVLDAFPSGFGIRAAAGDEVGWRLTLRWLGRPILEYPRTDDHPLLLAHCESRLHFAAHH